MHGVEVCVTRVGARTEMAAPSFRSRGMLRAEVPEHARDQGDGHVAGSLRGVSPKQ